MPRAGGIGSRALGLTTLVGLALAGGAVAQKPAPSGAPALPTAKPPPLGAPMPQAQPAPRPAMPPAAQAPAAPRQHAAPDAIPPNEPAAITRLRQILGPEVRLSYAGAQALDGAGERVRLTGVVLEQPDKRATAEEVFISGLREDGVAEAVIRGLETEEAGSRIRIGVIRITGLSVPRDGSGAPPQPDRVRLDALRVEGVEATGAMPLRLGLFAVENWVAGQPARLNLERLEIDRIDGGFVDAVRLARFAVSGIDFGSTLAALMRKQAPPTLVGRAALDLEGLSMSAGGRPVGGLREMRIDADVTRADGSGTGSIAFRGIRVEPVPMIADWLTRLGYQAIEADITADTAYDAGSGRVELRDLSLAGRDVGTLSFALTLDGLTRERAEAGDMSQMRLISMALRYADASLFRRFVAMQSRETRTPEAQLREQLAQMAGGALTQPGEAALDPIREAVQRFIRGQAETVEIRINPPQPLGMEQLQGVPPSPGEAQRLLGITATAR